MSEFDPNVDYFEQLKESEKYTDKDGRDFVYLRGLQRLAHTYRNGVQSVESVVHKTPSLNGDECIASVTITYSFKDGTSFAGSADASYKAHEAPFNKHLVAVAESKAEARALRRAFNIAVVSKEECGGGDFSAVPTTDNEPASDVQVNGLRRLAKRKGLDKAGLLKVLKRDDINDIDELTQAEAREAMKSVNKYKAK